MLFFNENKFMLAIQRRNALRSKYGESAFRLADVLRENCWNFCEKTDSSKTEQQKPGAASRIICNLRALAKRYKLSPGGYFGEKGIRKSKTHVRQIFTLNPVSESGTFFKTLSQGGVKGKFPKRPDVEKTDFPDSKSWASRRVLTSSVGSPAVEFKIDGDHAEFIPWQKIHFVRLGGEVKN